MGIQIGDPDNYQGWKALEGIQVPISGTNKPVKEIYFTDMSGVTKKLWTDGYQYVEIKTSGTVTVPDWAVYADLVLLGAGGGARCGNGGNGKTGGGGFGGSWAYRILGSSLPLGIDLTIGKGGAGGTGGSDMNGKDGGATTYSLAGSSSIILSANGGGGGTTEGGGAGLSKVDPFTFPYSKRESWSLPGVPVAAKDRAGNAPGGGAGAASGGYLSNFQQGKNGADGRAWVRFRSY